MAEGFLDVNGARLWYESAGDGAAPAVVLLHGLLIDRVLVGSGMSGYRPTGEMPAGEAEARAARAAGDIDRAVELGLQVWMDGSRRPDQVNAAARERTREMMRRLWSRPPVPRENVRMADPPAATRLGEIGVPTLVVIGGEDVPPIRDIADRLVGEVPGAQRLDVPDAGHHPNMEHPALFNEAVLAFLRGAVRS